MITSTDNCLEFSNNPATLCVFLFLLSCVSQLRELEDKYAECMEMLHEAQEELKNLRNKTLPLSTPRRFHSLGLFPMVSHIHEHVRMLQRSFSHFGVSLPGLPGSRNRGHHEEGTSDG